MPNVVSFLSDYGHADEFVGVCKAVMLGLAPELTIIDVTHDVPPHDVRAGALALVRAVQYLPEGIVVAVVDPGVGTDRRAIAVETVYSWPGLGKATADAVRGPDFPMLQGLFLLFTSAVIVARFG